MADIDPITLEVVRGYLVSTVFQMRATLIRTAYAPVLYETHDFSCGLLNSKGELAAMSEDFSGHVFAMSLGLGEVLEKFKNDIHPGDVLAVNDPYTGGTHLNDIAFYLPYFVDGKPLIYIAVRAHHADVGGATPGSFSGQDTEIYQEGVRIVPVKLIEKGVLNQALWDVIFANMRLSDEREGDALAMLDTARVAEMSLKQLSEKYGPDVVEQCVDELMDRAEETMRGCITELADGDYYYEQYMDSSGLSPDPLPIRVKLTIDHDTMTIDFTGTTPQVVGPMNVGLPVTHGGMFVIVKSWLDPKTPVNGGTFRPLKFIVPVGSCLAAELPAAVGGCWDVFRNLESSMIGLLSQVIPGQPAGESQVGINHCYIAGYDPVRNRPYIMYEYPQGGTAATGDTDGNTGCFNYDGGDIPCVYPAESAEQRQPLLIESLAVRTDGEGPGYHRSGFGVTRRIRMLSDTSQLNVMTERAVLPPWGASGAPPGNVNSFTVIRDGEEIQPSPIPGKVKSFPLKYGDVVVMKASAGGGVGDPLDREVERVQKEVFEELITAEHAREAYGVVIKDGRVDADETREQRRLAKAERRYFEVLELDSDEFDHRGCRISPLGRDVAAELRVGDGDMIEHTGESCVPLRGWVRVQADLPGGAVVGLGPIGRSILRVQPGQQAWLKKVNVVAPTGAVA